MVKRSTRLIRGLTKLQWPRKPLFWKEGRTGFLSIPFTWNLPSVRRKIARGKFGIDNWIVGGPAVKILPKFLEDVAEVRDSYPGVLQRVNPAATRSSVGCIRKCGFCAVGQGLIEPGGFKELKDWPDLPVYADNNILASSKKHFDRVIDMAKKHERVEFNGGLDPRLLTKYHANRLAECNVRCALSWDLLENENALLRAVQRLKAAGIPLLGNVVVYVLIGYSDTPAEAEYRVRIIRDTLNCWPAVMCYRPLQSISPIYVNTSFGWTKRLVIDFAWYWNHHGSWSVPYNLWRPSPKKRLRPNRRAKKLI